MSAKREKWARAGETPAVPAKTILKLHQYMVTLGLLTVAVCFTSAHAQTEARGNVKIWVTSPAEIRIRAESLSPAQSWSFRNTYAGVLGIAERVEQFHAFGSGGRALAVRKIATGEFRLEGEAESIDYVVRLPPVRADEVSHVSWIAGETGFLMLADLLPVQLGDVSVEFTLPAGWTIGSAIEPDSQEQYRVTEPEKTVFFIGRSLRRESKTIKGMRLESIVNGRWPFKDAAVLKAAGKVLEKYLELTGFKLPGKSVAMMAPLPVSEGGVKWRAETRGSTVVLLIDPNATIQHWPAQLGIIFTHELLHLWVPNALGLKGDYDWFFEGFTLYVSLVTALELKFINRDEYFATLGRVYDSYLSQPDGLSLIDASERRWTSGSSAVYDKGMLVALLYDLALRREPGGKTRLGGLYKELFARWATQPANGNEVIIQLLSSTPAGADLAKSYIEGRQDLNLKQLLADQKQLLKSLGYR